MSFLIGKWEGEGTVVDANPPVNYSEIVEVKHLKGPVHLYTQFTKKLPENTPLHSEVGYIRIFPLEDGKGKIEWCLAQPFGVCNIEEGVHTENTIELINKEDKIIRTDTAKPPFVKDTTRKIQLDSEGNLNYKFDLGTSNYEKRDHLVGKLKKVQ